VELKKVERNAVFRAIAAGGLDPLSCRVEDHYDESCVIGHPATESFFEWQDRYGQFAGHWQVGTDPQVNWIQPRGWPGTLTEIEMWATAVREWEETPDLWALARSPELAVLENSTDNEPFTSEQRAEIAARIDDVKAQVRETFGLEAGQLESIDQKLDDLVDASTRVGPKDWRVMLYGAAFGMIANDLVPPGVVQSILGMVVHGLAHILGLGSPPPAIPA
jgi:hypothetical protein